MHQRRTFFFESSEATTPRISPSDVKIFGTRKVARCSCWNVVFHLFLRTRGRIVKAWHKNWQSRRHCASFLCLYHLALKRPFSRIEGTFLLCSFFHFGRLCSDTRNSKAQLFCCECFGTVATVVSKFKASMVWDSSVWFGSSPVVLLGSHNRWVQWVRDHRNWNLTYSNFEAPNYAAWADAKHSYCWWKNILRTTW